MASSKSDVAPAGQLSEKLCVDMPDLAGTRIRQRDDQARNQRAQILDGVARGVENDDPKHGGTKILLEFEILVCGHESIESTFSDSPKQLAVA